MSFMEEGTGMQSAHVICPVFLIAHGEFAGILVNLTLTTLPLTSGVGLFTPGVVTL